MKTTMDKAGRVLIPAAIRDRAGLKPGVELEVIADDIAIHLIRTELEPVLLRKGRRLIAKPSANQKDLPKVDLAAVIEEERNRWPW